MRASQYEPGQKKWDDFAKHIFCIWAKYSRHTIVSTEERFKYPDVVTKDMDGNIFYWELQMSLSKIWEDKYTFPYRQPSFLDRKMNYEEPDYIYMVICPSTLAYYSARKSTILKHGELRKDIKTKGREGGDLDYYWYLNKDQVYWGSLLITKK